MKKLIASYFITLIFPGIFTMCSIRERSVSRNPNIIIIYADDLGIGDVSCYGATEIKTPNIDRIAREGIRFTSAYASSATCTPSRYALLTGEYPWKNKNARVLPGNAPLLIDPSQPTLPSMLQKANYITGVVGKWHLGLGGENINWNHEITPGPREVGFDYSFIMAATNDRVPTVFLENNGVVGLSPDDPLEVNYEKNFTGEPTGKDNPEMLKMVPSHGHDMSINNGIPRIGYMRGGKSALWIDENMSETFLNHSLGFIRKNKDRPFFLYYALHQPHVPRVPNPRFTGSSGMGPRGDVILELDHAVGAVLDLLDSLDLSGNTIIVFSSDNGPVLDDGYRDDAVTKAGNHKPSDGLRGGKYSLFDAGYHIPFIVRWPGTIKPGISNAMICQIDLGASFASLTGQVSLFPDSENVLDALTGKSETGRNNLILESMTRTCYREGDWVMIPPYEGPAVYEHVGIESGNSSEFQLYNLAKDPGQKNNLAAENPGKLEEMKAAHWDFMEIE